MSTYVYGITRATHPGRMTGRKGVGEDPATLRVVRSGELAAVVSDAPENLRPKRRDLEAHEAVLEALIADGTVLPMRFGALAAGDDDVERELSARADWYAGRLAELDGHHEVNLKAFHNEQAALSELLTGDPQLRAANDQMRAAGGDYAGQVDFGERVAAALETVRNRDAAQVLSVVRPYASAVYQGPPVDGAFLNVSLLVPDDVLDDLRTRVDELAGRAAGVVELKLSDPLPPYSFVQPAEAAEG